MSVTVRLLVYSGRPDPEWELDSGEGATLTASFEELVAAGDRIHPPPEGDLGYRGFLVTGTTGSEQLPSEFRVFRGVVSWGPGTRAEHALDTTGVENALLAQARAHGHGPVLAALGVGQGRD